MMTMWVWNPVERCFDNPRADTGSWKLLAADSWLVEDCRVRAFNRHRTRFARAAAQVGFGEAIADDFWAAVVEKIPASGQWFPRVDVLESTSGVERVLAFRLRPAPERTHDLRVLVPPYADPRTVPDRKGPDIALLELQRTQARAAHDCDEVLLLNEDGYAIEGATTSLLWWEGETLCAPDPGLGALAGVTSTVVVHEARNRSIPIEQRRVRPDELVGNEVWLVNALHGIRRVREFVDGRGVHDSVVRGGESLPVQRVPAGEISEQAERLCLWREWLDAVRVPLGM